eukprot:TRINITY_DN3082_c0_g2_i11.p1 TRINITY_DN3082_c0_g2~~TRINITY_DN3082_c0_g2_i11.p1  ORF type:complete len:103 (-),score=16.49 TRINITY_DN3082_c0_g2_i11:119-427(-)
MFVEALLKISAVVAFDLNLFCLKPCLNVLVFGIQFCKFLFQLNEYGKDQLPLYVRGVRLEIIQSLLHHRATFQELIQAHHHTCSILLHFSKNIFLLLHFLTS